MAESRRSSRRFAGDPRRRRGEPCHRRQRGFFANRSAPDAILRYADFAAAGGRQSSQRCGRGNAQACGTSRRASGRRSANTADRLCAAQRSDRRLDRVAVARHGGAARPVRFWLRPDQALWHSRRTDQRCDRKIRARAQITGDRAALRSPAQRACRHGRPAAGLAGVIQGPDSLPRPGTTGIFAAYA